MHLREQGCWEAYVSERALIQRYSELSDIKGGPEAVSLDRVLDAASKSDPHAIIAIHECAEYLALGIANIVNLLNPRLVMIGNALGNMEQLMIPSFDAMLKQKALPYLRRNVQVLFSTVSERTITLGATAIVLDAIFSTPTITTRESG